MFNKYFVFYALTYRAINKLFPAIILEHDTWINREILKNTLLCDYMTYLNLFDDLLINVYLQYLAQ